MRIGSMAWLVVLVTLCGPLFLGDGSGLLAHVESATVALPDAIVATWVTLNSTGSSTPAARCDHSFEALQGRINRKNALFPNMTTNNADPWIGKFWLFGGHGSSSVSFNESWILDVTTDPATWTLMTYSASSPTLSARWGVATTILASGLNSADEGITAMMFGGESDQLYLNDVTTLNFATGTLRTLIADEDGADGPFARSYVQWRPLPVGYGTGVNVSSATDSGTFFMWGGCGASDWVRYGEFDRTWDDEWEFQPATLGWDQFGNVNCTANTTSCSDQKALYLYTDVLTEAYNSSTLNITKTTRPAGAYSAMKSLLYNMGKINTTLTAALNSLSPTDAEFNNTGTCITGCTNSTYLRTNVTLYPPATEGYRIATVDGVMYMFGGYFCSELGVQYNGGDDCFQTSVWALDLSTMLWMEYVIPKANDPEYSLFVDYWPSPRAYGIVGAVPANKLIIFQGGAYQDVSAVWYYYADSYAFDTTLKQFVPLTVSGVLPIVSWSAGGAMLGNSLYLFGGCAGDKFRSQLLELRLYVAVEADNCYASGKGLSAATAGTAASFYIQTRESTVVSDTSPIPSGSLTTSITDDNTTVIWGKVATYGSGLTFTAQLVNTASPVLVIAKVVDMSLGLYKITYTATAGTAYKLFVYLGDDSIPGSPFSVTLAPKSKANATKSTVSGTGITLAEKKKTSTILLQWKDLYANSLTDNRYLEDYTDAAALAAMQSAQTWYGSNNSSFTIEVTQGTSTSNMAAVTVALVNNNNGSFSLTYDVPDDDTFYLAIALNNVSLASSPFTITGLDSVVLPEKWVHTFWALSIIVIVLCVVLSVLVHINRMESLMRTASPNFLQLLIFGSMLTALSVLFLTLDHSSEACRAFHTLLSVGLMMSISALLAKSHRVMRIFTAEKLRVQARLGDRHLMIPTFTVIGLMLLLNLLWMELEPLHSVRLAAATHPEVLSFSACQGGTNFFVFLGIILCYFAAVLIYGVYLAVRTGTVPAEFNESKLIAAAVYNVAFCVVVVVPLLFFIGLSSSLLVGRLVIEGTVILWCCVFNVSAVIIPKLLQLRLTPHAPNKLLSTVATSPTSSGSMHLAKHASNFSMMPASAHPPPMQKRPPVALPVALSRTGHGSSAPPVKRPNPRPTFLPTLSGTPISALPPSNQHASTTVSASSPSGGSSPSPRPARGSGSTQHPSALASVTETAAPTPTTERMGAEVMLPMGSPDLTPLTSSADLTAQTSSGSASSNSTPRVAAMVTGLPSHATAPTTESTASSSSPDEPEATPPIDGSGIEVEMMPMPSSSTTPTTTRPTTPRLRTNAAENANADTNANVSADATSADANSAATFPVAALAPSSLEPSKPLPSRSSSPRGVGADVPSPPISQSTTPVPAPAATKPGVFVKPHFVGPPGAGASPSRDTSDSASSVVSSGPRSASIAGSNGVASTSFTPSPTDQRERGPHSAAVASAASTINARVARPRPRTGASGSGGGALFSPSLGNPSSSLSPSRLGSAAAKPAGSRPSPARPLVIGMGGGDPLSSAFVATPTSVAVASPHSAVSSPSGTGIGTTPAGNGGAVESQNGGPLSPAAAAARTALAEAKKESATAFVTRLHEKRTAARVSPAATAAISAHLLRVRAQQQPPQQSP